MTTGTRLPTLPLIGAVSDDASERRTLIVRARRLTWFSLGWHAVEAGVAVSAGVVAGSVALVGFGADSLIEAAAGLVVLWLVSRDRLSSRRTERRAQQLIAASFVVLAAYIAAESARDLIAGSHRAVSWSALVSRR